MIKSISTVTGLTLAGVMAFGSTAALADGMPSRAPRAVVEAPFSWTGLYGGGNVGMAHIDTGVMNAEAADGPTAAFWGACTAAGTCPFNRPGGDRSGVIGGLQLGYNFQFTSFLLGIEADIQGSTANVNSNPFLLNQGTGFVPYNGYASTSLEWLGTVRGRLGFLATPTFLVYATGGFAYGSVEHTWGSQFTTTLGALAANSYGRGNNETVTGWTYGAGAEWAIASRVTIGAEYLYVTLDSAERFNASAQTLTGGSNNLNSNFIVRASDLDIHIARLKVNFKF